MRKLLLIVFLGSASQIVAKVEVAVRGEVHFSAMSLKGGTSLRRQNGDLLYLAPGPTMGKISMWNVTQSKSSSTIHFTPPYFPSYRIVAAFETSQGEPIAALEFVDSPNRQLASYLLNLRTGHLVEIGLQNRLNEAKHLVSPAGRNWILLRTQIEDRGTVIHSEYLAYDVEKDEFHRQRVPMLYAPPIDTWNDGKEWGMVIRSMDRITLFQPEKGGMVRDIPLNHSIYGASPIVLPNGEQYLEADEDYYGERNLYRVSDLFAGNDEPVHSISPYDSYHLHGQELTSLHPRLGPVSLNYISGFTLTRVQDSKNLGSISSMVSISKPIIRTCTTSKGNKRAFVVGETLKGVQWVAMLYDLDSGALLYLWESGLVGYNKLEVSLHCGRDRAVAAVAYLSYEHKFIDADTGTIIEESDGTYMLSPSVDLKDQRTIGIQYRWSPQYQLSFIDFSDGVRTLLPLNDALIEANSFPAPDFFGPIIKRGESFILHRKSGNKTTGLVEYAVQ